MKRSDLGLLGHCQAICNLHSSVIRNLGHSRGQSCSILYESIMERPLFFCEKYNRSLEIANYWFFWQFISKRQVRITLFDLTPVQSSVCILCTDWVVAHYEQNFLENQKNLIIYMQYLIFNPQKASKWSDILWSMNL